MRKRNHTVTIRMNKTEYDLLQNKVKESGRTQLEVVIKAIADLKIASTEEVEELKRLNQMFADIFIDFFRIPFTWYVQFCEWLVHPTYDNGFNQKIAYTGGEAWVIRILAIVAVLFILAIVMVTIVKVIKRYKKMWDEMHSKCSEYNTHEHQQNFKYYEDKIWLINWVKVIY